MSESYAELLKRLEATQRTLRNALEFINDDRHLTDTRGWPHERCCWRR
jgi:hypothetical protein